MRSDVRADEVRPVSQVQHRDAERDVRAEQQAWHRERAQLQAEFAQTIGLMERVRCIEENLAGTLCAMAAADEGEAAAMRLELATAAVKGAQEAAERSTQLQRQADRWARQADVVDLLHSARYAGTVLADQARTEKEIADALMSLASRAGPDRAAQLPHLAEEALAGVQRANDRARSLHDLAASVGPGE